eukprot:scaffold46132_cov72-Phaeocystis_antarctica.AAC.2
MSNSAPLACMRARLSGLGACQGSISSTVCPRALTQSPSDSRSFLTSVCRITKSQTQKNTSSSRSPFCLMKQPSASSSVSIGVSRNQLTNTLATPTCGDSRICRRWHT